MYGYIYMIINKVNGKKYIGQHKSMNFCHQDKYMGSGKILYRAYKKYGIENFEKLLVQYVETKEDANKQEKFWIAHYDTTNPEKGYNITKGGEGTVGLKHSEESRRKMSKSQREYYLSLTEEEKKIKYGTQKGKIPWNKGIKENLSEETRKKMSEAKKGNKISEEHKRKMSEALKGSHPWYKGMTWKLVDGKRVWIKKEER